MKQRAFFWAFNDFIKALHRYCVNLILQMWVYVFNFTHLVLNYSFNISHFNTEESAMVV